MATVPKGLIPSYYVARIMELIEDRRFFSCTVPKNSSFFLDRQTMKRDHGVISFL